MPADTGRGAGLARCWLNFKSKHRAFTNSLAPHYSPQILSDRIWAVAGPGFCQFCRMNRLTLSRSAIGICTSWIRELGWRFFLIRKSRSDMSRRPIPISPHSTITSAMRRWPGSWADSSKKKISHPINRLPSEQISAYRRGVCEASIHLRTGWGADENLTDQNGHAHEHW